MTSKSYLCGIVLVLASISLSNGAPSRSSCTRFSDEIMGTLVPCPWRRARGMLCMQDNPDMVIWPDKFQARKLEDCGFKLRKSRKKADRTKRDAEEDFLDLTLRRRKRETDEEEDDDDYYDEDDSIESVDLDPSVTSGEHQNSKYNYRKILEDFMGMHYGKGQLKKEEISAAMLNWIETNLTLQTSDTKGHYRTFLAPAKEFDEDNKSEKSALAKIRLQLSRKQQEKGFEWIDVEEIVTEFHICHRMEYSSVVDEAVNFNAPTGETKNSTEASERALESSLHMRHFRVDCQRIKGRVLGAIVLYSDALTFERVSRKVASWVNNPITQIRYVNQTKEKLVEFIRQEVHNKTSSNTGKKCTSYQVLADELKADKIPQKPGCNSKHLFGCSKFPAPSVLKATKKTRAEKCRSLKGSLRWSCYAFETGALKKISSEIFKPVNGRLPSPNARAPRQKRFLKKLWKGAKKAVGKIFGGGGGGGLLGGIGNLLGGLFGGGGSRPTVITVPAAAPPVARPPTVLTRIHCEPYEIKTNDPVVFDVKDSKIVKEITPIKFVTEVNNWKNITETVFAARTISFKERRVIKTYLKNVMKAEIAEKFEHFLN